MFEKISLFIERELAPFQLHILQSSSMDASFYKLYTNLITGTLCLGRISGAICHRGILKWNSPGGLQTRFLSFQVLYTLVLSTYFFVIGADIIRKTAFSTINSSSQIVEKLEYIDGAVYCVSVFLTFAYFLTTSSRLSSTLKEWNTVTTYFINKFTVSKSKPVIFMLTRELIAPFALLSLGIVENLLFDLNNFRKYGTNFAKGSSLLEKYFYKSGNIFANHVPYHPIFAVLFTICDKCGILVWNYGDMILIVFGRLCTKQLCGFSQYLRENIAVCRETKGNSKDTEKNVKKLDWENVRVSFIILSDTLQKVANYLVPLAILCYVYNVYQMIIDIFLLLSGSLDVHNKARNYVELVQLTLRISLVTYHLSEMHHSFRRIAEILPECPRHLYDLSVQRLEKFVDTRPFGVYLLGTVLITKRFFISIISFVFTTEIVLLQSMAVMTTNIKPD